MTEGLDGWYALVGIAAGIVVHTPSAAIGCLTGIVEGANDANGHPQSYATSKILDHIGLIGAAYGAGFALFMCKDEKWKTKIITSSILAPTNAASAVIGRYIGYGLGYAGAVITKPI